MKLSYREKWGLLIVLVVAIIVIFVAAPIKMIKEDIKSHEAAQAKVQKEYDEVQSQIAEIEPLKTAIQKIYDDSKGYSDIFVEHQENFEADQYIAKVINMDAYKSVTRKLNKMEVVGQYTVNNATADELEFYCEVPDVVTYPILEAADINGNLLKTEDEKLYEKVMNAVCITELDAQEVEQHVVTVEYKFTKPALMNFLDEMSKINTGIRITDVTIDDPWFGLLEKEPEKYGYSNGTITFCFYTMQKIAPPDFSK